MMSTTRDRRQSDRAAGQGRRDARAPIGARRFAAAAREFACETSSARPRSVVQWTPSRWRRRCPPGLLVDHGFGPPAHEETTMPRFAANLSTLFTEVPLAGRFERAARAGFSTVELQFPYELPAAELRSLLASYRLSMVLHNLPAGDWAAGDRGIAVDPARQAEFRAGVALAVRYATTLGVPRLNCLAGIAPPGIDEATARRTLVENLRYAAGELRKAGIGLLVEPLNTRDVPGFWLDRSAKAIDVLDEVDCANAQLQYDIYHAQRGEGELAGTLERLLPRIGHVQVADNPGRHEPGTGEINYGFLFAHLDRIGYRGYIGCEYRPANGTEAGLAWLETARRQWRATC
jgi:hydroxypyruvate isomerase